MREAEVIGSEGTCGHSAARRPQLDACVRQIAQAEGVPPFASHAREVIARTLDLDGGSSRALAGVIHKDLGLTSQVLRAANSAVYNHSGKPILSVPHSIVLLGWDSLRSLAGAIRYIEHFACRSPGLRELMLLSMLSAVHSREIAVSVGYPRPDEAYVCGLFRNLGEVLIGCHYPEQYSRIILTMQEENINERAACLRVLDFSWDEVAWRVASGWTMPPQIYVCLRGLGGLVGSPLDRCLASMADCARDLTHAMYRGGAAIDAVRPPWIFDPQGRRRLVPASTLRRLPGAALEETRETFAALGVPADSLRLDQQAERARRMLASLPAFDPAGWRSVDEAAAAASRTLRSGNFELTTVISALLEALRKAGFDRTVFGLLSDDRTALRGRLASGGAIEDLLTRFDFPADHPDGPLRAALQYKNDVLIDCSHDGRYDHSTLVNALAPAVFAIFPIVVDRQPVGCLYADRQNAAPDLDSARVPLALVRDTMAAAIRGKSRHAGL